MEKLIALVNIQHKGKQYIPGEELPVVSEGLKDAWKRAGSVKVSGMTGTGHNKSVSEGKKRK